LSWGGETIMAGYRAYLLDEENHIAASRPIEADSDAEAMEMAKQYVKGNDVEVWLLDRMVGRLARRPGGPR
jgi:hypothetical protein